MISSKVERMNLKNKLKEKMWRKKSHRMKNLTYKLFWDKKIDTNFNLHNLYKKVNQCYNINIVYIL